MGRRQQRGDFLATPELGEVAENVSIVVRQTGGPAELVVGRQRNPLARVWLLVGFRVIDCFAGTAALKEREKNDV